MRVNVSVSAQTIAVNRTGTIYQVAVEYSCCNHGSDELEIACKSKRGNENALAMTHHVYTADGRTQMDRINAAVWINLQCINIAWKGEEEGREESERRRQLSFCGRQSREDKPQREHAKKCAEYPCEQ